jgi:hypothetical protein
MEIEVTRKVFQGQDTIGDFTFPSNNNNLLCNTLEPVDRGLYQTDTLEHILAIKVPGLTAIPYGRYKVILDFSPAFNRIMPHIIDVPGFEGERIHVGNSHSDTKSCVLLGEWCGGVDFIRDSGICFDMFMDILGRASDRNEDVWITIKHI